MTSYNAQGLPMIDQDALNVYSSPVKQSSASRPATPSIKREFYHGARLSDSPTSPCHSISSSSMATSGSSGSLSSVASQVSSIAGSEAELPNSFPYNIIKSTSPGRRTSPFTARRPTTPSSGPPPPTPQSVSELSKTLNKRARSDSSDTSSSSPAKKLSPEKKTSSPKDGFEVWPEDVEAAFMEALRLIPKLGRRKVHIDGKACGRNELIAIYIMRKTQQLRSRKQVSSHIQVLKNIKRNDAEFMDLVYDGEVDGEGLPQALLQAGFQVSQIPCFKNKSSSLFPPLVGLAASPMDTGDTLLSPYTPTFLSRESSYVPSPLVSPLEGPATGHANGLLRASAAFGHPQASPGSSLAIAMKDMQFPFPSQSPLRDRQACALVPNAFCLWAGSEHREDVHVYTQLDNIQCSGAHPLPVVYLEDLHQSEIRFAKLAQMYDFLPCQFLHAKLQVALPSTESGLALDALHTSLSLLSLQDLNLTSVVTIFANGTQVLSMEEPINGPFRRIPDTRHGVNDSPACSGGGSPAMPHQLGSGSRYRYIYNSSLATDFWSVFLRGNLEDGQVADADGLPPFAKSPMGQQQLHRAVGGISAIQEFVIKPDIMEGAASAPTFHDAISPGSSLGHVVLVVAYDFSAPTEEGPSAPAVLSYISMRHMQGSASPARASPGFRRSTGQLTPAINFEGSSEAPAPMRTRPNLTVNIPNPNFGQSLSGPLTPQRLTTPITPAMQIMHTPPHEYFYKA